MFAPTRGLRLVHSTYKLLKRAKELRPEDLKQPRRLYHTWRVLPYTMVSLPRLSNAYDAVREVVRSGIPGDIAECGVWAGGSAGLMACGARDEGDRTRRIHLFDSFEGLPQPSPNDGKAVLEAYSRNSPGGVLDDGTGSLAPIHACAAPLSSVRELFFKILRVPEQTAVVHKGWFQETVPAAVASGALKALAVLRLDGDWYESTRVCLEHLYPLVSPGGFVLIDDYGYFEGCRKAVDEYLARLDVRPTIVRIDSEGVYFRKP